MKERSIECYKDIIDLEYNKSTNRANMKMSDRASQFAPFAALTGHKEKISETARIVENEIEISDSEIDNLNLKYATLMGKTEANPIINVTYFKKDDMKNGGKYLSKTGTFLKIDEYEKTLVFSDKTSVDLRDIVGIEGSIFSGNLNSL